MGQSMAESIKLLERAVAILDSFTLEQPALGVREVARRTGLSASTAGRLMSVMKRMGMLNQDPESQQYMMGSKMLAWAGVYTMSCDVRSLALPVMVRLLEKSRETISLYVLEGKERVCVERLESPETVRIGARVGRRIPLYAGSAGKVFLAFMLPARRDELLAEIELKPMTSLTIIEKDKLLANLEEIRRKGYAFSRGEWILDAAGVAAPVFDQFGRVTAALTISGPAQRFKEMRIKEMAALVKDGADEISAEMGFIPRHPKKAQIYF
jgi:DNA-binding IclR family transcriptional regulator